MNKTKLFILIIIFIVLIGCTTGCNVTYGEPEPEKNCYRFVDYSGNEYIESMRYWQCGISKGNLHCRTRGNDKHIMVQEYERIVCPENKEVNNDK